MKLIIAEKPSVARAIAQVLGVKEKKEAWLEGGGYTITWALGHLVQLAMPEDYGMAGFKREHLPILPGPYLLIPRQVKKGKVSEPDAGAFKQLKVIEKLLAKCDSIIVATDAGREGELIFRYIYQYLQSNKPFERLWISSLTDKAIRSGFEQLQPGANFDKLYQAAKGRSQADWLVGINGSQALTITANNGVYSLGRVQTPTLALICKRYLENKNFAVRKYWQLQLEHRKEYIDFKSLSAQQWEDAKAAEKILAAIQRNGIATVTNSETKTVKEAPPLLFDLTGLQKEANKKLNLSATETLAIAQGLYEQQFITYPRTGSKYIPEDLWPEVPALLRALEEKPHFKDALKQLNWSALNKQMVNDLKITDHHGLLITDKIPAGLPAKENALYEMIAFRLIEAVFPVCVKELTTAHLDVLHHEFIVKGSKIVEPGWRSVKGHLSDEEETPLQVLPDLSVGDELKIKHAGVLEKKTKAPPLYTEASLLTAMETAGSKMETEEERKILQSIGIGTPATRAAIIETLFTRSYIIREKKSLLPTEKGLQVYELVKEKKIADVAMTARWELSLQSIENRTLDAAVFQKEMEDYATTITQELLAATITGEAMPELLCPKCKTHPLLIREKVVKCPDDNCGWLHFRNICGVQLSITDIESLVTKGKTPLIKNMKSKAGKAFNAFLVLGSDGLSNFEFERKRFKK